ncbi:MAG: hypothetical protein RLZ63_352 [Pseudomonadota bacterium]|jgi:hypothetical protein
MSGATYINLKGALPKGMPLPKPPSPKYRNLISADGQTYYLLPTRVYGSEKVGSSKKTKKFMLDFSERYNTKKCNAIFVGVQRGLSVKPIDCSYVDATSVALHSTSTAEIISMVERIARLGSGAAVAMFDLPETFRAAVNLKPNAVQSITFTGRTGARQVQLRIEYERGEGKGGIGVYEAALKGAVFSTFSATLDAKDVSKYLWNEAFSVRLNDRGLFELDSAAMNGTLYLPGKLAE